MTSLDRIATVASAAEQADGAAPLDEATWLALRHDRGIRTWVDGDGVALLAGSELNLVVHPAARGRGVGSTLLAGVLGAVAADFPLRAWSHTDHPAAARLASTYGFEKVRELWVMRRPASLALPELVLPAGVRIRGFRETDTAELLRVNAASFAAHPEQGGMDEAGFAERISEPWFDPAGLLIAEDATGRMLGFHWTKQHSPDLGEVYVVGVSPSVQGRGVGRLVTLAGLHHLAGLGVSEVVLYVESDNAAAIAIYRDKLGFTHAASDTHVMYARG